RHTRLQGDWSSDVCSSDLELADAIRELLQLPGGSRVFRYGWDDKIWNLTSKRLNDYVKIYLGDEFSAKDFRTWGGTLLASVKLRSEERRVGNEWRTRVGTN